MKEPLNAHEVRRLIREILANGVYWTSSHAQAEMRKDELTELDVVNVLRGGVSLNQVNGRTVHGGIACGRSESRS
jgi:hypothetical protein